jgi:hypothetical protein
MENVDRQPPYFVELKRAPKFTQIQELETTVLSQLHGEQMMMALNATLPGYSVPAYAQPHEQIGMVCSGRPDVDASGASHVYNLGSPTLGRYAQSVLPASAVSSSAQ